MKRSLFLILISAWIIGACVANVQAQQKEVKIFIKGQEIQARGILGPEKRLPLVPVEAVCQALEMNYFFDKMGNAIVATKGNSSIYAPVGNKEAIVSGEAVTAEEAPRVEKGIAYMQASLLQQAFGVNVNWKPAEGVLEIAAEAAAAPPAPPGGPEIRLLSEMMAEKPGQKTTRLFVDGKELGGKLAMEGGRLLAPVKPLAEALGCTVSVGDVEGQTVFSIKTATGTTVDLAVDSDVAHVGNLPAEVAGTSEPKEGKLPTPCRMVKGEIYVPVVGTVELLGDSWVWKQEEKEVDVFTGQQPPEAAPQAPPPDMVGKARLMSAILAEKPGLKPVRITVDGLELEGELAMEEGRLLAPADRLTAALGWAVAVDGTHITLTEQSGKTIALEVGSANGATSDAQGITMAFELPGPARVLAEHGAYLPVAGIVEAMGGSRSWDAERKTAEIFNAGVAPPQGVQPPRDGAGQARLVSEIAVAKPPRVMVDGHEMGTALATENGRVLAPLHVLANELGWQWAWCSAALAPQGAMGARKPGRPWVYFPIGSEKATDGQTVKLGTPVRFLRGMLYVPVADFAEMARATWVWDKQNKVIDIRRPTPPESATKIGEILSNPAAYSGRLLFVTGKYAGKEPADGGAALSGGPPHSPEDWILDDGTGAIYVIYDPASDLKPPTAMGQEIAIWALVRLTTDSRPYLEPGLQGGRWELAPAAQRGG